MKFDLKNELCLYFHLILFDIISSVVNIITHQMSINDPLLNLLTWLQGISLEISGSILSLQGMLLSTA
jgi:hypothetical protein